MPRWTWLVALLLGALVAGCTASSATSTVVNGWRSVPLPSIDTRVLAIVPYGNGVLVLGSVPGPDGRAPGAWTTTDGTSWHPVPLQPHTFYAGQAELVSVGAAGGRIMALGQAFGGAHSNPRLTVWSGDTAGLVEHEQPFEMFGGPHAIAVNDAAARPGTALLVGQWDGATGRYGATVWTSPDGATWHRNADDPAMASAVGEQTAASGAAAGPRGFLVAGDTLHGATLAPLAWTSPDGLAWHRVPVPTDTTTSQAGGATANRAACDDRGCVIAGIALGDPWHAMCWPVGTASAGITVGTGTLGPSGTLLLVSQALLAGDRAYLALRVDNRARLASTGRDCTGWQDVPLPIGADEVRVGQLAGRLLLATTDQTSSQLWLRA
ncbi:MAG TPA: hypothetical protein VGD84_18625 [Pseudonocardiaceae bacterium]